MKDKFSSNPINQLVTELEQVNDSLALLLENDIDLIQSGELLKLVSRRDELVADCLVLFNEEDKSKFAEQEYKRHQNLEKKVKALLEGAKDEAINFVRNKKKAKKYVR